MLRFISVHVGLAVLWRCFEKAAPHVVAQREVLEEHRSKDLCLEHSGTCFPAFYCDTQRDTLLTFSAFNLFREIHWIQHLLKMRHAQGHLYPNRPPSGGDAERWDDFTVTGQNMVRLVQHS